MKKILCRIFGKKWHIIAEGEVRTKETLGLVPRRITSQLVYGVIEEHSITKERRAHIEYLDGSHMNVSWRLLLPKLMLVEEKEQEPLLCEFIDLVRKSPSSAYFFKYKGKAITAEVANALHVVKQIPLSHAALTRLLNMGYGDEENDPMELQKILDNYNRMEEL